jgi:hypothetical protein
MGECKEMSGSEGLLNTSTRSNGSNKVGESPNTKRRRVETAAAGAPSSPPPEQIIGESGPSIHAWQSPAPASLARSASAEAAEWREAAEAAAVAAAAAGAAAVAPSSEGSLLGFYNNNSFVAAAAAAAAAASNVSSGRSSSESDNSAAVDEDYFPFAQEFNQAEEGDFDFFRDDENVPTKAEIDNVQRVLNGKVEEGDKEILSQILSEPVEVEAAAAAAASPAPNNTAAKERRLAAEAAAAAIQEATQLSQYLQITRGGVRLEPLPPTPQAIQIHGTYATALRPETTICSLCGFSMLQRRRPTKHLGGGSYEHTLPVNLVVFFFRSAVIGHMYNTTEIELMSHLGDIACIDCNTVKNQTKFIRVLKDGTAIPNIDNIKKFLERMKVRPNLSECINTLPIDGISEIKKAYWYKIQYENILDKCIKICDFFKYVDVNRAARLLKHNEKLIKICKILDNKNALNKIMASVDLPEFSPWKKPEDLPGDDFLRRLNEIRTVKCTNRKSMGNLPFDSSTFKLVNAAISETMKEQVKQQIAEKESEQAVKIAKNIEKLIIKTQKNITELAAIEMTAEKYKRSERIPTQLKNLLRDIDDKTAVINAEKDAIDQLIIQVNNYCESIKAAIGENNDVYKIAHSEYSRIVGLNAARAAPAPRRRRTYGGARRYKQHKTLKRRRVNKKATRRKGTRHTRRRA